MITAFAILGSVASIVGILIPATSTRQRFTHLIYGVAIVVLAYASVQYQLRIDRVTSVERAASRMVSEHAMKYTKLGFVHASLAFLEKNQDLYPDTYDRAQNMCLKYKCDSPDRDSVELIWLSSAMDGLLRGIATIDGES